MDNTARAPVYPLQAVAPATGRQLSDFTFGGQPRAINSPSAAPPEEMRALFPELRPD